ncbi:hypothetical protein, partial [Shigella sonnei]
TGFYGAPDKFGYAPSAVLKNTDQHPTDASPHN